MNDFTRTLVVSIFLLQIAIQHKRLKKKRKKKMFVCFANVVVSKPCLQAGKLRQRHRGDNSCGLPILSGCSQILITHLLYTARHPTISGLFLVQMLRYQLLVELHRIRAGDKLHQRPACSNSRHKWFPTYHCATLQHDQNLVMRTSLYEQLLSRNKS